MGGEDKKMAHFVESILEMIKEYEKAKEQAVKEDRGSDSDYYKKQIENLKNRMYWNYYRSIVLFLNMDFLLM